MKFCYSIDQYLVSQHQRIFRLQQIGTNTRPTVRHNTQNKRLWSTQPKSDVFIKSIPSRLREPC